MDFCRNVPVSGGLPPGHPSKQDPLPAYSTIGCLTSPLDDLFPGENTEDLEWLSMLVEDCLSSSGNCIPAPKNVQNNPTSQPSKSSQRQQQNPSLPEFVIPGKARSKRKRAPSVTKTTPSSSFSDYPDPQNKLLHVTTSDPPLLQQAYWLADSELVIPRKVNNISKDNEDEEEGTEEKMVVDKHNSSGNLEGSLGQPRRCTHCLAQRTPQWRAGPLGPKTLCNACGVRFKSGRLLPEYRPAKSPTFVSYKHSNSHKKVMEMRMSILSSVPTSQ